MVGLASLGIQALLNVPEALLPARLGVEKHGHMAPRRERLGVWVGLVTVYERLELMSGYVCQKLLQDRVIMDDGSPPSVI